MNDIAVQPLVEVEADRRTISKIEILETNGGQGVFAKEDIMGDAVIKMKGVVSGYPTRYSIQLDQNRHLRVPPDQHILDDPDFFWTYLNHSCQPNGYINTAELAFRPLRKIGKGEECTFNYLTTEYELAVPFACHCGADKCFGLIRGYKYLSGEQKEELSALAVVHPPA